MDRCARAGKTGYGMMHGSVQSAEGMPADTMMRRLRFQDLLKTSTIMSRSKWVASKQMIHGSCSTENMSLAPVTHAKSLSGMPFTGTEWKQAFTVLQQRLI